MTTARAQTPSSKRSAPCFIDPRTALADVDSPCDAAIRLGDGLAESPSR